MIKFILWFGIVLYMMICLVDLGSILGRRLKGEPNPVLKSEFELDFIVLLLLFILKKLCYDN